MSINPGPVPAYSNPPIQPQNFMPSMFFIEDILRGVSTLVTTSSNHNYVIGQLVRLLIPFGYGSRQLDGKQGYVVSIPSFSQVLVNINSQVCDAFIPNPSIEKTKAQILAIGDINTGIISSTGRTVSSTAIPGSFQNISPQFGG